MERAEAVADELGERTRHVPGETMEALALALGHEVRFRPRNAAVPMRGFCLPSPSVIYVLRSGYGPRDEFTIAHEIAELHLPRALLQAVDEPMREKLCDRAAAALLLPRQRFLDIAAKVDHSLPDLRRCFPLVSYETLATRLVDVGEEVTASSWVRGERAWWRGPGRDTKDPEHIIAERSALSLSQRRGRGEFRQGRYRGRAWRLTARGKRVALTLVQPR